MTSVTVGITFSSANNIVISIFFEVEGSTTQSDEDDDKINEEINNLQKEKDMPLKELLALYNINEVDFEDLRLQDTSELQELLPNNEDDDPDFNPKKEKSKWKTTIMVGKEYQVEIPEIQESTTETNDLLLWDPKILTDEEIVYYLRKSNKNKLQSQIKDDVQSLYVLMENNYNINDALKSKIKSNLIFNEEITPFSDLECLSFEEGLTKHGKDFWKIQQNFVKTRSVKELVHFYYLWKKTERHDAFVVKTRTQKKRYLMNPGLTDYMDRFFRDPNNLTKNKENCVKSIPGIINGAKTDDSKCAKITRSKSKLNCIQMH